MSDNDRVLLLLGRIDERTEQQARDMHALTLKLETLQAEGCLMGATNRKAIQEIDARLSGVEGLGKKALLAVTGVAIGSVGLKEAVAKIIDVFTGG